MTAKKVRVIPYCPCHCTHNGTFDPDADLVSSLQGLYDTTLALLEQALHLWPGTNVRMHYVDKLLSANKAQQLNPPPALLTGAACHVSRPHHPGTHASFKFGAHDNPARCVSGVDWPAAVHAQAARVSRLKLHGRRKLLADKARQPQHHPCLADWAASVSLALTIQALMA